MLTFASTLALATTGQLWAAAATFLTTVVSMLAERTGETEAAPAASANWPLNRLLVEVAPFCRQRVLINERISPQALGGGPRLPAPGRSTSSSEAFLTR